ncbi:MAG TPA: hypothetical protein VG777_04825 [Thermoanaerobaculia bacterium]|nr:hypothetical protein [Thermoanaerobaculia bacterium]
MRIRLLSIAVFLVCTAARSGPAGEPRSDTPEAVIASLYAHHQPGRGKEVDTCDRAAISRYCDARLTDLFLRDCACAKKTHEVCNLDWDPFYDSQDFGKEDPRPRIERLEGSGAFEVTIRNLGETKLTYEMTKTPAGWRIANVRTPKWDLREVLSGRAK